jgi:hypothetical protein
MIYYLPRITREIVREYPDRLFVFGDNVARQGMGGQAKEMRGEPNAVGIPTKWTPTRDKKAYFYDDQLDAIMDIVYPDFHKLYLHIRKGKHVVWPKDGIGTGLAQLPTRAPEVWNFLEDGRKTLEWFVSLHA